MLATPSPSQALTRQLSQRESPWHSGKVSSRTARLAVSPEPLPLGEVDAERSEQTERARLLPAAPRFRRKRRCNCRFPLQPLPVKKQFRNARRRFGTTNKNILSAIYAQSNAERISNRPALPYSTASEMSLPSSSTSTTSIMGRMKRAPFFRAKWEPSRLPRMLLMAQGMPMWNTTRPFIR